MLANGDSQVFIAGGVSLDTIVHLAGFPEARPGTVFARDSYQAPGGTTLGKAFNLRALGVPVVVAAQFGLDGAGDFIRAQLKGAGVQVLELPDERTEQHTNLMNEQGERLSIFTVMRTFDPPVDPEVFRAVIERSGVVMLDIMNWSRHLIPLVKELAKPIWCDLHDFDGRNPYHLDYLRAADVVFFSSEAMPDWRAFMQDMREQGKDLIVATHGARGASALTRDGVWLDIPALADVPVTDTNGAGDAFLSGFYFAQQRGLALPACLEAARQVAALCVQSRELASPQLAAWTPPALFRH